MTSRYIFLLEKPILESRERSSPNEPGIESGSSIESSSSGGKPGSSQSGSQLPGSSSSGQAAKPGGHSASPKFSIYPAHYAHIRNKNKGYVSNIY